MGIRSRPCASNACNIVRIQDPVVPALFLHHTEPDRGVLPANSMRSGILGWNLGLTPHVVFGQWVSFDLMTVSGITF